MGRRADWKYRRTFRVDDGPADSSASSVAAARAGLHRVLAFDGLDTLADVNLNGRPLGSADNMFRSWRWDVTDILVPGDNEIVVFFHSPGRYAARMDARRHLDRPKDSLPGAPYLRKAPCHLGWDWSPKLPNVGIWKSVRLETWQIARIADVKVTQKLDKGKARVSAEVRVERAASAPRTKLTATVRIEHPDGRTRSVERSIGGGDSGVRLSVDVEKPELWWPNGLGGQPLYRVEIVLSTEGAGGSVGSGGSGAGGSAEAGGSGAGSSAEAGSSVGPAGSGGSDSVGSIGSVGSSAGGSGVLDRRTFQIGLRTLELRRKPDEWGESFTFVSTACPFSPKAPTGSPPTPFRRVRGPQSSFPDRHLRRLSVARPDTALAPTAGLTSLVRRIPMAQSIVTTLGPDGPAQCSN